MNKDILTKIEQKRARLIAAGIRCPDAPVIPSFQGSIARRNKLDGYLSDLAQLERRIGQPAMQKPKLEKCEAKVRRSFGGEGRESYPGHRFSFPQYDGLGWFVCERGPRYRVTEFYSGMGAGSPSEKSRTAAIAAQWDILENMRMSPKHDGSHSSVVTYIKTLAEQAGRVNQ